MHHLLHRFTSRDLLQIGLANMLPLMGVLFAGWDIYLLLLYYWLETVVIAFWALAGLVLLPRGANDLSLPDAVPARLVLAVFMVLHAGLFLSVHLVMMSSFFGSNWSGLAGSPEHIFGRFIVGEGLWVPLLAFFLFRGAVFLDQRHAPAVSVDIVGLYLRIFVMQSVIIFGALGSVALGDLAGLLLLVAFRLALDLMWPELVDRLVTHLPKSRKAS